MSGLWGMQRSDWPDTSIGHVAKYVITKNYRAPPPWPPPFYALISIQPDKIVKE